MNKTNEMKQTVALAKVGLAIMMETKTVVDTLWIPKIIGVCSEGTAIEEIMCALEHFLEVPEGFDGSYEMTCEYFETVLELAGEA